MLQEPSILSRLLYPFFDVLFTPTCCYCNTRLSSGEFYLCHPCWSAIPRLRPDDPLLIESRRKLCVDTVFSDVISLFRFEKDRELQSILHELKYGGKTRVGLILGRMLGERIREAVLPQEIDACIPVPLHRAKHRERGYNQSELICRGIRDAVGIRDSSSLIRRVRHTVSQTTLSVEERRSNVDGAFAVSRRSPGRIKGKNFLVVDDVITTGATIRECATVLKGAGAAEVIACSVALAS